MWKESVQTYYRLNNQYESRVYTNAPKLESKIDFKILDLKNGCRQFRIPKDSTNEIK